MELVIVPLTVLLLLKSLKIFDNRVYDNIDVYLSALLFYVASNLVMNIYYLQEVTVIETKINSLLLSIVIQLLSSIVFAFIISKHKLVTSLVPFFTVSVASVLAVFK